MIANVGLLPFDAIKINYQYVGLCIPGVGEKKYYEMARVLYQACEKTMPLEVDAVKNAFKNSSCQLRDGYKLLWTVMTTSQPAFCPYKRYPEPQWHLSRDVTTHAKRWILFFRFMGKSYHGYSSDTEQCLHFLRTIQEPALLSQVKSLEVNIHNINAEGPLKFKGRASFPPYLLIDAMAETLAETVQPLDHELQYAPSTSMTSYIQPPLPPIGYNAASQMQSAQLGQPYPSLYYGNLIPYNPVANMHTIQGSTTLDATINWTERNRGGTRGDGDGRRSKNGSGNKSRVSRKPRDSTKPKLICQACYTPSHETATCWTLARALLTTNFVCTIVDRTCWQRW